ncbi:MAG: hypothetical protein OXP69_16720 [Spirochaetaceae bacterium]|nr:hypothetical protein [Spirochaetaceae bacterium]
MQHAVETLRQLSLDLPVAGRAAVAGCAAADRAAVAAVAVGVADAGSF